MITKLIKQNPLLCSLALTNLYNEFKDMASHKTAFDYQFALYGQAEKPA